MLMPVPNLQHQWRVKIRGIIHVGACKGEESEDYERCGIHRVIWCDCNPNTYRELYNKVGHIEGNTIINAAVSNIDNQEIDFHITNNNSSSSVLPLKEHLQRYPDILEVQTIKVKTRTIDNIMESFNKKDYNFLNLDIQGYELKALQGATVTLPYIDYVYCEVNFKELYEGCALFKEVKHFLQDVGFELKALADTGLDWGDSYWQRNRI